MKPKYRFVGRRWNPMRKKWFYCWVHIPNGAAVQNTFECTDLDGFWERTKWEGLV